MDSEDLSSSRVTVSSEEQTGPSGPAASVQRSSTQSSTEFQPGTEHLPSRHPTEPMEEALARGAAPPAGPEVQILILIPAGYHTEGVRSAFRLKYIPTGRKWEGELFYRCDVPPTSFARQTAWERMMEPGITELLISIVPGLIAAPGRDEERPIESEGNNHKIHLRPVT